MESFGKCLKYFMLKINSDRDSSKMPLTLVDDADNLGRASAIISFLKRGLRRLKRRSDDIM